MKKQIIIPIALSLLCSCGGNNTGKKTETKQEKNTEDSQNIMRTQLNVHGNFNQITSLGGINIIYTQGDYSFEVEGDSIAISHVKADVESGILTLYTSSDNNPELNAYGNKQNITAYISSPDLKCVALCSTGDFTSHGTWKEQNIELGVIGSGSFNLDSVECDICKHEATGGGDATFKHINATEDITLTSMGNSDVEADINTELISATTQKGKLHLTGTAKQKDLSATNKALIEDNIVKNKQ